MTVVLCAVCHAKTDAFLCRDHTSILRKTIAQLPARVRDLELTATRQSRADRTPSQTRPAPPEDEQADTEERLIPAHLRSRMGRITLPTTALPFTGDAAALYSQAVNACVTWARHIAETRGVPGPSASTPATSVLAACTWLVAYIDAIRMDEAAGEMFARLTDLEASIDATVDRTEPDLYAGKCDRPDVRSDLIDGRIVTRTATCGAELYARMDAAKVKCQACGAEYEMAARREWLLAQIPDVIESTAAIANGLTSLLEPVTPSMIRQMAFRHEIVARGSDGKGALYRVGDVLAVLVRRAERKAARSGSVQKRAAS